MLIDAFFGLVAVVVIVDLLKLFVDQSFAKYTPKHGRRRSV